MQRQAGTHGAEASARVAPKRAFFPHSQPADPAQGHEPSSPARSGSRRLATQPQSRCRPAMWRQGRLRQRQHVRLASRDRSRGANGIFARSRGVCGQGCGAVGRVGLPWRCGTSLRCSGSSAAKLAIAGHRAALARWCPAVAILSRDTAWGSTVPDMEWALSGNGHAVGGRLCGEVGS